VISGAQSRNRTRDTRIFSPHPSFSNHPLPCSLPTAADGPVSPACHDRRLLVLTARCHGETTTVELPEPFLDAYEVTVFEPSPRWPDA
jgi:hypothetical protein